MGESVTGSSCVARMSLCDNQSPEYCQTACADRSLRLAETLLSCYNNHYHIDLSRAHHDRVILAKSHMACAARIPEDHHTSSLSYREYCSRPPWPGARGIRQYRSQSLDRYRLRSMLCIQKHVESRRHTIVGNVMSRNIFGKRRIARRLLYLASAQPCAYV